MLMADDRVGARVLAGPRHGPDVRCRGRQLGDQRQVAGAPDGSDRRGRRRRVQPEGGPPRPVRARQVELHAGDPGHALEPPGALGQLARGLAAQVEDHGHGPAGPRRRVPLQDVVQARVLEPDAQQQPGRDLGGPRRGMPATRLEARPPGDDGAQALQVHEVRHLRAVPERTRGDDHRVRQHETPSQVHLEGDRAAADGIERGAGVIAVRPRPPGADPHRTRPEPMRAARPVAPAGSRASPAGPSACAAC